MIAPAYTGLAFLIGKSRLAPVSAVSIPRLELTAAVLAVKLDILIQNERNLPNCSSTFWTDSTAVLQSIYNSKKRFPTFVANRISVIEQNSRVSSWRHVPSKLNPADLASRGISAGGLVESDVWLTGLKFLWETKDVWPCSPVNLPELPLEFLPAKRQEFSVNMMMDVSLSTNRLLERYSTFRRLRKAAAWLLRYKTFLRARLKKCAPPVATSLSVEELQRAENEWIKYVQRKNFSSLMTALSDGSLLTTKVCNRSMMKLSQVIVDDVMRVGGRLDKAPIDFNAKHPIILPHFSCLVDLLICWPLRYGHTWPSLRQRYWIIKDGVAVRRVIGKCLLGRKRNAEIGQQYMADLPAGRLKPDQPPFSQVGIDYFGPFLVKQGRSEVKRYGCVFTCLSVRAIHIEISHSLSTDSFIDALRGFTGRRGTPRHIYSDNGTNFVGAERILRESLEKWNQQQINDYLRQKNVTWTFNPPTTNHMGGVWERMIRSIRRILSALMKEQTISDETLSTMMVEVESIINSRPLVPVTLDPRDDEPLTPNHLLLLRANSSSPPGLFEKKDCYVRRRWAQVQYLANQFWLRWVREFLPHIIERQKCFGKTETFPLMT